MRKCILGFALILSSVKIFAQQQIVGFNTVKAPLWEMRQYNNDPLNVRYYTFVNGLTLITSNQKTSPRIYTMVAVRTGSKNDPSTNTGLAHYLEHMLFKGTDKYGSLDWNKEEPLLQQIDLLYDQYNQTRDSAKRKEIYRAIDSVSQKSAKFAIANEYDKMCQALGAEGTNAFTSNDETVYINDIPSNMVSKWLSLESERFRNPVLRLFHTELEAVYEEKNISLDRDGDKVYEKLFAELFTKHNYGLQTTIGTVDHLKNPSLKAIRNYYNEYYVPNNMAIIMSGDFDPDAVAQEVAQKFGYMKKTDVFNYVYEFEPIRNVERSFDVVGPDAESVTIGFRIPNAGTDESRAAKLIDLLLNNSQAGLMDLNLVKQQKVLSANSGVEQMNDYGVFMLLGKPKEGQKLEEVKDLMLGQLEKIRKGEFDEGMLKAIILNQEISQIGQYKENTSRCFMLKDAFIQGVDYRDAFNELAYMKAMSKNYIVDFANDMLNIDRVVIYKRKGEPAAAEKIVKPEIHSVELNRDKQSDFVKNWLLIPTRPILPEVVDLRKVIQKKYVGPAVIMYTQNTQNRLFSASYRYNIGKWNNNRLGLIGPYLKLVGTDGYSAAQVSQTLYRWGCSFGAGEENLNFNVWVTGPEEYFDSAVWLLEKMITNPQVDQDVFQSMIGDILKNRLDAKLNPSIIRRALTSYAIYGLKNPFNNIVGESELKAMKASELVKLIQDLKTVKHGINYYGQRDLAGVEAAFMKYHHLPIDQTQHDLAFDLSKSKDVGNKYVELEQKSPKVYFAHYPQVQANINWMFRSSVVDEKDVAVATAFNQYFGGDMSSVVFQNIRESKALAYSTYANYNMAQMKGKNNGVVAFVGCQADKFHDAVGAMNELLQTLPQDADIFSLAKESLVNRIETGRLTEEYYISAYLNAEKLGFGFESPSLVVYNEIKNMSIQDIAAFHKERISGKPYAMAIVGDSKRLKKSDLSKYGSVMELSLEQIFGY